MPADTLAQVRALLDVVTEVYRDSAAALARVEALRGTWTGRCTWRWSAG